LGRASSKTKKKNRALIALVVILILLLAFFAAYILLDLDEEFKFGYPLEYEDLIVRYSNEYNLDPYLVAAVIKTESTFKSDAVSSAGAVGLMQIMPETGEWLAGKFGEAFETDNLYDPETNIRYGCWYLHFLMERFDGQADLAIAAYNAGHNRVEGWLLDEAYSDGTVLTNIPYSETENYVKKVNKAYSKYKEFYEIG
jgi:soluble lytic murein transglycosylase